MASSTVILCLPSVNVLHLCNLFLPGQETHAEDEVSLSEDEDAPAAKGKRPAKPHNKRLLTCLVIS